MTELFLGLAKVQTFRRDVNRMRRAVAMDLTNGDAMTELQDAWAALERWLDCVNPNPKDPDGR